MVKKQAEDLAADERVQSHFPSSFFEQMGKKKRKKKFLLLFPGSVKVTDNSSPIDADV